MTGVADVTGPNALLRYLRAPADPVSSEGPSKLDIATSTWQDDTVVIPHKAAILRDWLFEIFMNGTARYESSLICKLRLS